MRSSRVMSTCGVLAISTPRQAPITRGSSPLDLPSPSQLFGSPNRPQSKPEKRSPLSLREGSLFQTAATLLRNEAAQKVAPELHHPTHLPRHAKYDETLSSPSEHERSRDETLLIEASGTSGAVGKRTGDCSADQVQITRTQRASNKQQPNTKRANKSKDKQENKTLSQAQIAPGKIIKASARGEAIKAIEQSEPALVETLSTERQVILIDSDGEEAASLGIKKALARRRDWTLSKNSSGQVPFQTTEVLQVERTELDVVPIDSEVRSRTPLLGSFSFEPSLNRCSSPAEARAVIYQPLLKKRRIEVTRTFYKTKMNLMMELARGCSPRST